MFRNAARLFAPVFQISLRALLAGVVLSSLAGISRSAGAGRGGALGPIERDSAERILHLNQYQAFAVCLNQNPESQRTVVAQALGYSRTESPGKEGWERARPAQRAIPKGAVYLPGILDVALAMNRGAVSAVPRDGFQLISADGVEFFYNRAVDEIPAGDLKENFFWSSSLGTSFQGVAGDAYVLNGDNGAIFTDYRMSSSIAAVRCARAQ